MALTKTHIIESLFKKTRFNKRKSEQVLGSLIEIMKQTLESGEDLMIPGFGKFEVKENSQRNGRRPFIYGDMIWDKGKVVTFRCSPVLKKKINGNGDNDHNL